MKTNFLHTAIVFIYVSSEGDVIPSGIFEPCLRLISEVYVNFSKAVVKPWLRVVAIRRQYAWQQDSISCYTSLQSQKWLSEKYSHFSNSNFWPPNDLICNPIYYHV